MGTPSYSLGKTLLKIESVCLEYDGRPVLKNVNAEVRDIVVPGKVQGQVVGVLGPSGCGKTTLFRIIAGLNAPTSGRVTVNGLDRPVRAGEVGVVAQSYPLFEHRTVLGNLMLAAIGRPTPEMRHHPADPVQRALPADGRTVLRTRPTHARKDL